MSRGARWSWLMAVGLLVQAIAAYPGAAQAGYASGPAELHLVVNLPSFRLELLEGETVLRRYTVSIGDSAYPTPTGRFVISRVEWDPWWVPPASPWAEADSMMGPGPGNPMGRVRLGFRELYFIHGTPNGQSLGMAASHGCIRLSNADAIDLAKRVLSRAAPGIPAEEIEEVARRRGRTRLMVLDHPVTLDVRYDIAKVESDILVLYRDVYRRVSPETTLGEVLALLGHAMGDLLAIDTSAVRDFVNRAAGNASSATLESLRRQPG